MKRSARSQRISTMLAAVIGSVLVSPLAVSPVSASGAVAAGTAAPSPVATAARVSADIGSNELISARPHGQPNELQSAMYTAVDGSGRYVTFTSAAHLVPGSGRTHHRNHAYVRDTLTDTTAAIDVRTDGRLGHGTAAYDPPSISADGRFVAFVSGADDLAPGGDPSVTDVFVRDMVLQETAIVSLASDGGPTDTGALYAVISADGSTVVFFSRGQDLVDNPGADGQYHVYRHVIATGVTTLVDQTPTGAFPNAGVYGGAPSVSADGNLVTFISAATDIVAGSHPFGNVILYDAEADRSTLVNRSANAWSGDATVVSADGTTVVYSSDATNLVPGDTNDSNDVFAYDVGSGETTMVSRAADGSAADDDSATPCVSADGGTVAFVSVAKNLVEHDRNHSEDIFVVDRATGAVTLASRSMAGGVADGDSREPSISGDGTVVAYHSEAFDIVPDVDHRTFRTYAFAYR